MYDDLHRDKVFVAGGQPTVTYVKREDLHMERQLARAVATPNQIVSLSGPTKTGKTVLCRKVLGQREYVWVDGGQINSAAVFWDLVCSELRIPYEVERVEEHETGGEAAINAVVLTAAGSHLYRRADVTRTQLNSVSDALRTLVESGIVLVVDDFHYIEKQFRSELMRNVKGAVFNGLKVVLLSVTHRTFDAIKAESELTGRFTSVELPTWSTNDLKQIAVLGFDALGVLYSEGALTTLAQEAQESPFLMQKFGWEICFDHGIEKPGFFAKHLMSEDYRLDEMFIRIARDAGLPIYQALVAGPQSRSGRIKRPLRSGKEADKYEATLLALAETGPKPSVSYEELRSSLGNLLTDSIPQKHEITSALKHLAGIATRNGSPDAIDWDEEKREVNLADPYLRFYLRWQVRRPVNV